MSEQPGGADKVLTMRFDLRSRRKLRQVQYLVDEAIPRGYALKSVVVKAFVMKDAERGRP